MTYLEHTRDSDFKQQLRVPRAVFEDVLERIKSHPLFDAPVNVGARKIPVDKQLACFLLRIGANEFVHSIRRKLAISEGAVSTCVRRVATTIGDRLGGYVTMPRNGTPRKAAVKKQFKTRERAFILVEHNHYNKKRERMGEAREDAGASPLAAATWRTGGPSARSCY